jgi:hypothetical protein
VSWGHCYTCYTLQTWQPQQKNGIFWVVTPCGSCKNRRFRRNLAPPSSGRQNRWTRNNTSCN